MRTTFALCLLGLLGLPLGCTRAESEPSKLNPGEAAPATGKPNPSEGPLVVELFTSQGCSSCPPADRLLAKLATAGALGDRAVAPLAFHVDYWNDLGWADPFSLPAWTERQHQYARALKDDRVYTPELVVGGATGVIGSNLAAVTEAIQGAARPSALPATARWAADAVTIAATAPADADVWVAVWEAGTSTKVTRGENSGQTLGSERVVRRFERVAAAGLPGSAVIKLGPAWRAGGATVFAQRADRRIIASASLAR